MRQPFDWDDLTRELDRWAEAGRVVDLWWRDDDAVEPTPALRQLLDLADAFGIELGLAVIPAAAKGSLAAELAGRRDIAVLQHGYRHRNHAPPGGPAIECGGARPVDDVLTEMRSGYDIMQRLLPDGFAPILAAPWNRIARPVLDRLSEAGYRGASAMGPRALMAGAPGLVVQNAHVDPLNWKEGGRFAGLGKALSGLIGELSARRTGAAEQDEPLGILTHHLVHDHATWEFLRRFFATTSEHPAARWRGAREVFGLAQPQPAVAVARP
jgi:peptidoglycan/xylan/chitin deacetylase (PgdA/CDA1 family)